jgi:hypothetical protein
MSPTLDYALYPHIIDSIIRFSPHEALLELRLTCKKVKRTADSLLHRHLVYCDYFGVGEQWLDEEDDYNCDWVDEVWRAWGTNICMQGHDPTTPHLQNPNVRILDVAETHMSEGTGPLNREHVFPNTTLIRAISAGPADLYNFLGLEPYDGQGEIHFNLPEGMGVRFIQYHRGYPLFPSITGALKKLIFTILYDPNSVDSWIPSFPTPTFELECDEIFILLVPEGDANIDRDGMHISDGPAFLSDIAYKFGKYYEQLWAENRRIIFVGGEEWEHEWLSKRIVTGYELEDPSEDDEAITEKRMRRPSVTDRFKWWLFKIADYYGEEDTADFQSSVSFMTLDEFTAKIDDNELAPLMTSLHLDQEQPTGH